jgi:cation diffusion facilitator CzcD-associated flavoprotein CzcO
MHQYQWAIIGAGPAGIAAVGHLLDADIPAKDILWFDPFFTVGDLGRHWQHVSSNTRVELFMQFLHARSSFNYAKAPIDFKLNHLAVQSTCRLEHIAEPLQWITQQLMTQVSSIQSMVHHLELANNQWHLSTDQGEFSAKHVILAQGAEPVHLEHVDDKDIIPLSTALNPQKLSQEVSAKTSCAVFGSSHTAIILLQSLLDLGVKQVINFYRSPCRYAMPMKDWILFDNTGLKGQSADWARQNIDGVLPQRLLRVYASESNLNHYLPQCDKMIYAVGFKTRGSLSIGEYQHTSYNPHVGIIAPGLFGFGIAYPEMKADPFGNIESQVGLWKFMLYLNKVLPIWLNYRA